jgi:hypothetical protein
MPRAKIRAEAQRLRAADLSVIPILADGTKCSVIAWKSYQARRPTSEELRRWFAHTDVSLGVIAGHVSGGLEILDFDAPDIFTPWCAMVFEELAPGLLARLPQVHTPHDGRHVYYRCPVIRGNHKLAQRLNAEGRPETMIEPRGEGGYVIVPPSPPACHPLHKPYVLLQGDLAAIPTISSEERSMLLNAARALNEYVKPEHIVSGHTASSAREAKGERPGDLFNASAAWPDILDPYGWMRVGRRREVTLWKRPGKRERGLSATTNYAGSDLLYVFSTNAWPFEADTAYSKFAAYALLEHAGDFSAAAKASASRGYGARTVPVNGGRQAPFRTMIWPKGQRPFRTVAVTEVPSWQR